MSPKAKVEFQYRRNQTQRRVSYRHTPIVLDTLSNTENDTSNITFKNEYGQSTIHYRSTLLNIHLCTNIIKIYTLYQVCRSGFKIKLVSKQKKISKSPNFRFLGKPKTSSKKSEFKYFFKVFFHLSN